MVRRAGVHSTGLCWCAFRVFRQCYEVLGRLATVRRVAPVESRPRYLQCKPRHLFYRCNPQRTIHRCPSTTGFALSAPFSITAPMCATCATRKDPGSRRSGCGQRVAIAGEFFWCAPTKTRCAQAVGVWCGQSSSPRCQQKGPPSLNRCKAIRGSAQHALSKIRWPPRVVNRAAKLRPCPHPGHVLRALLKTPFRKSGARRASR
jgi:hypothetical protein